jgi:hypothetical protein
MQILNSTIITKQSVQLYFFVFGSSYLLRRHLAVFSGTKKTASADALGYFRFSCCRGSARLFPVQLLLTTRSAISGSAVARSKCAFIDLGLLPQVKQVGLKEPISF